MRLTRLIKWILFRYLIKVKWILFGHCVKEADEIPKASSDAAPEIPAQAQTREAYLQYYDDQGVRFCKDLKEGDNCVGSSYQADFVVGGAQDISAKHAVITKKGDQYFIENVSPEGKTLVNGVPLAKDAKPKPIQYGAVILLDDLRMEFLHCPKEA